MLLKRVNIERLGNTIHTIKMFNSIYHREELAAGLELVSSLAQTLPWAFAKFQRIGYLLEILGLHFNILVIILMVVFNYLISYIRIFT